MPITLSIEPVLVEFDIAQREAWSRGERDGCSDPYCKRIGEGTGTGGFGEYLVGMYWEQQGYSWIHHDFDIFAGVKRVYEPAESILRAALGERLDAFRMMSRELECFHALGHASVVEHPDLLIHHPVTGEVRFAECKRLDTRDSVNPRQALGLFLIESVLGCPADVFVIAERGKVTEPLAPIEFSFPL